MKHQRECEEHGERVYLVVCSLSHVFNETGAPVSGRGPVHGTSTGRPRPVVIAGAGGQAG